MDIFDEDLLNFWRCLNKYGVRYIMVGGVATILNECQHISSFAETSIATGNDKTNLAITPTNTLNIEIPTESTMSLDNSKAITNVFENTEKNLEAITFTNSTEADSITFTNSTGAINNKTTLVISSLFGTTSIGNTHSTEDIDIWIEETAENIKKLEKTFIESDMGEYRMEKIQFILGGHDFYLNNGIKLDVMIKMKGLEHYSFAQCRNEATVAEVYGIKIPFLNMTQLLLNKKAVNRPKDQRTVMSMEKIKEQKGKDQK